MTNDRLAIIGTLCIAAGLSLVYFPAGLVFIGGTILVSAVIRAWADMQGGQEG